MRINRVPNSGMLLIDGELAELKNDAECATLPKITELVKKSFNLTRIGKDKPHCPIFHFLACFVKPIRWLRFSLTECLIDLTHNLAIG